MIKLGSMIKFLNKYGQEKIREMIDLSTAQKGVIAQIKEEGRRKGIKEGKKKIINRLLTKYSLDETSYMVDISREEILELLNG